MIYVLYGPDTYSSRKKLKGIIEEFRKKTAGSASFDKTQDKPLTTGGSAAFPSARFGTGTTNGSLNLEIFDAEEDAPEKIFSAANSPSLFREKKLIVIERILSPKNDLLLKLRPHLERWKESKNDIYVFWDAEAINTEKLEEIIKLADKKQKFELLDQPKTKIFIEKEAMERQLRLSEKEKVALMARHRNNLWGIVNELDKISLGGSLSREPALNKDLKIYNFLDALSLKQKNAPRLLYSLYENGFDEIYIYAAMVNHARNLLLIKKTSSDPNKLAKTEKSLNLHPFVWEKSVSQSSRFKTGELEKIFSGFLKYDTLLKIGKTKLENIVFEVMYS